jgi:sterol desaturase/sphingolipid hydroxylase (fatty acid hydroxylase superfamily)
LAFPVLMGGLLWGSYAIAAHGPKVETVGGLLSLLLFLVVVACERFVPHRPDWNRADGQLWNDLGHTLFGTAFGAHVGNVATSALFAGAGLWATSKWGGALWPIFWPPVAQVVLVFLVADLGRYVQHRLLHGVPFLWRFHQLHHSGEVLTALKASRSHIVERITQQIFMFGPLIFLGAPAPFVLAYVVPNSAFGLFSHSNADFRLGYLEYVLMGPGSHRLHHSADMVEGNSNFGSALVLWDIVFGTYVNPRARPAPSKMGIANDPTPKGFLAQIVDPFRATEPLNARADSGGLGR